MAYFKAIHMRYFVDTIESASSFGGLSTLYETPTINGLIPYKTILDGTVKLNTSALLFNPTINMYMDTARRADLNIVNWKTLNSTNFPNINYTTTKPIPQFNIQAAIPKTLSKNSPYTIHLGNLPGVDKIEFTIENNQFLVSMPYYRLLPGNIGNINIPPPHLQCLTTNPNARVRISFINEEEQTVNNKAVVFQNRLEIIKSVSITN